MRRLVDISVPLQAGIASDPPGLLPEIDYYGHADTVQDVLGFFPGATASDLPDGEGWAVERVRISTHNGTHLDAPYHYSATMDGGARAITIDEVPLEWCLQPAVKLDFRHFDDGYVVTAEDVAAELDRIGHRLSPLEIVVVNTAAGTRYGTADYVSSGCGMGRAATLHLLEQGIRLTGTDAWSWDAPSSTPPPATPATTTPRSSGRVTEPVATSATATWRNSTTWSPSPRPASK
ncbi:putative cyclase [Nocardia pseudobrasiliensis]|uniref:Putative cyclase n=1 Tax=Nocardia pseudobrasiliensis TaxID=45979 RepID=A0A370HWD9_9NOCA|nr:cyclase family protein [Nocardia pseudobrasiliensis]RDI62826.1 putative cyclase [Nocardia pseudobrasiliensis]